MPAKSRLIKIASYVYRRENSPNLYVYASFKRLRIPRLLKSLKTTNLARAKALALEEIHQHQAFYGAAGNGLAPARAGKPIREIIDQLLKFEAPKRRASTRVYYKIYYAELNREWGHRDVSQVTPESWSNWLAGFMDRKKRKTFGDYAKYMNKLLRFAYQRRYVSHLVKVESPDPVGVSPGRVFSEKEIRALWDAMNEETRDQFVLCYECFMRLREALYLTWDRVNLKEREITLGADDVKTGSRTGRGRTFVASQNAISRLRFRFAGKKSEAWVFPSKINPNAPIEQNKTAWIAAKRRAKISGRARWHDLRHTAITRALLERHVDPLLVSEYAGVSLKTLQRVYLHSTAKQTASVAESLSVFGSHESHKKGKR